MEIANEFIEFLKVDIVVSDIIMTPHGFINDDEKELKAYKNQYAGEWSKILGGTDFQVVEEGEEVINTSYFDQEPE